MLYKKMLEEILYDVQLQLSHKYEELRTLPDGSLLGLKQKANYYYYRCLMPKGFRKKLKKVGISRDIEMIRSLARKKLLQEECSLLQKNISCLKTLIDRYAPVDTRTLISRMKGAYATLHPDMFNPLVAGSEVTQNYQFSFRDDELIHMTPLGLGVRSKSELVIAGRLEHFGFDITYEPQIILNGHTFRPDFVVKSKRTGKTIYWEHAGMMEDYNYMQKYQEKLSIYYEHGIVPWKNLIQTYDNADGGLDVRLVDAMIRGWLL